VSENGDKPAFDEAYLARLRAGDPATQRHFVEHFGELLRLKLQRRLGMPSLVEEARQEVYLRVFDAVRRDAVKHPERFGAFVNAVAGHVVLEYHRNEGRIVGLPEGYNEADSRANLEERVVNRERKAAVVALMGEMPERWQKILTEVFIEERAKPEVCARMGVDRGQLRVLVHRARKRFAEILDRSPK